MSVREQYYANRERFYEVTGIGAPNDPHAEAVCLALIDAKEALETLLDEHEEAGDGQRCECVWCADARGVLFTLESYVSAFRGELLSFAGLAERDLRQARAEGDARAMREAEADIRDARRREAELQEVWGLFLRGDTEGARKRADELVGRRVPPTAPPADPEEPKPARSPWRFGFRFSVSAG